LEQLWANNSLVPITVNMFVAWIHEKPNIYGVGKVLNYSERFATVDLYTSIDEVFSLDPNTVQPVKVLRNDIIVVKFNLTIQQKLKKTTQTIIKKYFTFFQDEVFKSLYF
jgi:hypothetical protein